MSETKIVQSVCALQPNLVEIVLLYLPDHIDIALGLESLDFCTFSTSFYNRPWNIAHDLHHMPYTTIVDNLFVVTTLVPKFYKQLQNVTDISIAGSKMQDVALNTLAFCTPKLQKLNLVNASRISVNEICSLAKSCKQLTHLTFYGHFFQNPLDIQLLSNAISEMKQLAHLDVGSTPMHVFPLAWDNVFKSCKQLVSIVTLAGLDQVTFRKWYNETRDEKGISPIEHISRLYIEDNSSYDILQSKLPNLRHCFLVCRQESYLQQTRPLCDLLLKAPERAWFQLNGYVVNWQEMFTTFKKMRNHMYRVAFQKMTFKNGPAKKQILHKLNQLQMFKPLGKNSLLREYNSEPIISCDL